MRPGIRARRDVDHAYIFVLEQFADAKYVVGITDRDAAMQSVGAHDDSNATCRFRGVGALSFGNQRAFRDAASAQILVADSALAEFWIGSRTAGGNDDGRHMPLI